MNSKMSGPEFFKNKLRLLAKREELDVKSGGRLTSMYAASCVFSLLEILRASFKIKGCLLLGLSTFRRYGSDPVVKVALRHFPLSWRKPVLAMAVQKTKAQPLKFSCTVCAGNSWSGLGFSHSFTTESF